MTSAAWWGAVRVPQGSARRWRIGPFHLRVARFAGEWRLEREVDKTDPLADELELAEAVEIDAEPLARVDRYGFAGDDEELDLEVALADRAVVSRPEESFRLPAGERITLFVGTPLWIRISAGGRLLSDEPILRPSDTFFGQTTMEGELCYASRTFCRARLEKTIRRPHRALSAVHIQNLAEEPLPLERIKLPVPYLALYLAADGRLWTEDVSFERREGAADTSRLEKHPPNHAQGARLLAPARIDDSNLMKRAFASLFHW